MRFFWRGAGGDGAGSGWKLLGAIAVAAGSIAIVFSGTRGALLGLTAGAIVLAIWKRPRLGIGTDRRALRSACWRLIYISPAGVQLRARWRWALDDLHGGARLLLWRDSLRMAAEQPLVGFGPETFGLEFPRYQLVALSASIPRFLS